MKALVSRQLLVWGWLLAGNTAVFAQPVIENFDRFELNWSTMRLRFYGEAGAGDGQKSFDSAEKAATDEGLSYALNQVARVRQEEGLRTGHEAEIAHDLTKQAYVVNTTYYADGKVRVDLEGNLSKALDPVMNSEAASALEEPQAPVSDASALLVEVKGVKSPSLLLEINSPDGEVLYSAKDVARSAFRKNLLGRWFYQNSTELKNFRGKNPVMLEATSQDGKIVLNKEQWDQIKAQHPRLIEDGKLAFVIEAAAKASSRSNF